MSRPKIDKLFSDDPILDILHIAYMDLQQGRFTSTEKIRNIMFRNYPNYSRRYIQSLILILIKSQWFNILDSNNKYVHIKEKGIETYIGMCQKYKSEKRAQKMESLSWLIIYLTIIAIVLSTYPILKDIFKVINPFIKVDN